MLSIGDRAGLREQLAPWRDRGNRIAVVPTMGNLHDGHLSLVDIAREHADRIVVTIFVNPTQFGANEDFATYPRSLEEDRERLQEAGVDVLFQPDLATVYPFGSDLATRVSVPGLTDEFCGAVRPGHFDGVASVVMRLFALVQPHVAVFGQKDYQQQLLIRRMVEDIGLPVQIETGPVIREADGLAMSSRNANLGATDRKTAAGLYRALQGIATEIQSGRQDFAGLENAATWSLEEQGMSVDYVAIRGPRDLQLPVTGDTEYVVLAAVRIGQVRLIDNVLVSIP